MSRIIYRQLICREDFALGQGTVVQERGQKQLTMSQMEVIFIFRTVNEIKALDYLKYNYIGLYQVGPAIEYYFHPTSTAIPDDVNVIKPDSLLTSQPGRYIKVPGSGSTTGVFDTIIASASDELTPITVGNAKTTFRAPYPLDLTNGYVRISLTTANTGAAFIVQLTVNGTNLFTTPVQIDDGDKTSVGSSVPAVIDPAMLLIPDDAEFIVNVTQVGSTIAGTGLKVAVTGVKTS